MTMLDALTIRSTAAPFLNLDSNAGLSALTVARVVLSLSLAWKQRHDASGVIQHQGYF